MEVDRIVLLVEKHFENVLDVFLHFRVRHSCVRQNRIVPPPDLVSQRGAGHTPAFVGTAQIDITLHAKHFIGDMDSLRRHAFLALMLLLDYGLPQERRLWIKLELSFVAFNLFLHFASGFAKFLLQHPGFVECKSLFACVIRVGVVVKSAGTVGHSLLYATSIKANPSADIPDIVHSRHVHHARGHIRCAESSAHAFATRADRPHVFTSDLKVVHLYGGINGIGRKHRLAAEHYLHVIRSLSVLPLEPERIWIAEYVLLDDSGTPLLVEELFPAGFPVH